MAEERKNQGLPAKARGKNKTILIFYTVIIVLVVVGAILMSLFVFFKVSRVNISGTTVYGAEELVTATGIQNGDNLVFLNTDQVEEKLFAAFPYVEKVRVKKQIPSTVEIIITEAQAYYSMAHGDNFVYVSKAGKILEVNTAPKEGSILVKAGELSDNGGYISLKENGFQDIFTEILSVFADREAGGITELDITNIHDISLVYDNRVTLKLGNAADLTHKINFGLQIIDRKGIADDERGILDLSLAKEVNKAYFTPDALASPEPGEKDKPETEPGKESGGSTDEGEAGSTDSGDGEENSENGGEENSGSGDEDAASESTRGDDIPDVP